MLSNILCNLFQEKLTTENNSNSLIDVKYYFYNYGFIKSFQNSRKEAFESLKRYFLENKDSGNDCSYFSLIQKNLLDEKYDKDKFIILNDLFKLETLNTKIKVILEEVQGENGILIYNLYEFIVKCTTSALGFKDVFCGKHALTNIKSILESIPIHSFCLTPKTFETLHVMDLINYHSLNIFKRIKKGNENKEKFSDSNYCRHSPNLNSLNLDISKSLSFGLNIPDNSPIELDKKIQLLEASINILGSLQDFLFGLESIFYHGIDGEFNQISEEKIYFSTTLTSLLMNVLYFLIYDRNNQDNTILLNDIIQLDHEEIINVVVNDFVLSPDALNITKVK